VTISEKIKEDEWHLYEILRHPILFGEFYRNLDDPKEEFEYSQYQKLYLGDFNNYVSLCCGRAVGKTLTLTDFILWLMINNFFVGDYIVYTVPNKVHLEPVFFNIVRMLRTNPLLKNFIEPKRGINASDFTVTLLNNSHLRCRIAGTSGTGTNVVGLHAPVVIIDEAGFYPWGTWQELQPTLNSWQEGFKMWVSGVPTGLRENNVLFFVDERSDAYSHHQTSAHENPRYTADDEVRNIKQYGGIDSEDYIHFVLGRHGSPTFAVFDRRLMQIETYATYRTNISGVDIESKQEMITKLASIPRISDKVDAVFMGVDLGYTEPTSIMILYEKNDIIKEHARINLSKVKYPIQEEIIDYLDSRYNPFIIGMDTGNEQGVAQHLTEDEKYLHKNYASRLVPVKFGAWLVIGTDQDGNELKVKIKPHAVTLLQEYTNTHRIVYASTDLDLVTELERMTYTKTAVGDIVYKTLTPKGGKRGEDHNTSAMLCAVYAYHLAVEGFFKSQKPDLLSVVRWI